jgi:aminoglycoside/choline kinase family phosphotransferase
VIAMHVPGGTQELGQNLEDERRWPFLEVRQLLAERGVRVPQLVFEACDRGVLLVEVLGDDTLANYLEKKPSAREALYQAAIADLARAQKSLAELPEGSIIKQRAFDYDLLKSEIYHFLEWGLEARGIDLTASDRSTFDRAADYVARTIAAWPRGFVHRDYQSRNLMVTEDGAGLPQLTWIDFQDAMLGPRTYDLVALLSDSYQEFTPEFVRKRLDEYAAELGLGSAERAEVGYEFDLVTVQRKLKDAGRFVFIERVNKNPSFLKFVEPTILKALGALARLDGRAELKALHELLLRVTG